MRYNTLCDVKTILSLEVVDVTAKITSIDTDYLVREYLNGRTQKSLANEFGVSQAVVSSRLVSVGIPRRRNGRAGGQRKIAIPMDAVISRYTSGESTVSIGEFFGVDRGVIRDRLIEWGIPLRGVSDANKIMMEGRTPEENARNCQAAHDAARGRKHSLSERCKMASTREKMPSNVGPSEIILYNMLLERGIDSTPQKAVGPYNCDLAAFPVAVEVWGGNFHYFGRHMERTPKRCHYFFDGGWSMLFVHVGRGLRALSATGADYIAAYIQAFRSDPSAGREYRMIWGTGEFIAAGSCDDDDATIIETLHRSKQAIHDDPLPTW